MEDYLGIFDNPEILWLVEKKGFSVFVAVKIVKLANEYCKPDRGKWENNT